MYRRRDKLVMVNGEVAPELSPRLSSLSEQASPPLDDGRRGAQDEQLSAALTEAIDQPPWLPAIDPDALIPLDEDDLAGLRALGYVGDHQQ